MANLRDIRRRIRSIRNTQQVFKAMKMVSAARLRRAQDAIVSARPYARKLQEVLSDLASRARPDAHPLLAERPGEAKIELVVVCADRGLCGSFNSNVFKRVTALAREHGGKLQGLHLIGRKGREFFRRRNYELLSERFDPYRGLDYARAAGIAQALCERFSAGQTDAVVAVYNEFKSIAQQRVVVERLLPIERTQWKGKGAPLDYLFEPEPEKLFARLVPLHLEFQVFRLLLESVAAEHASRMAAMDSATRNAGDLIHAMTLHLNRVRQASITKDLIEVISGAEALA